MTVSLKHNFSSAIPDDGNINLIQPSNWNDEHALLLAEGKVLGRLAGAGTGAATEIGISVDSSGNTTLPGELSLSSELNLAAGTSTKAPYQFQSGSLLTTAAAGSVEYDGSVIYSTPIGAQRGVIPSSQFFRLNSSLVGANVATAQKIFGVGCTLSASTVYAFEMVVGLTKAAGTTSHTVGISFGGTSSTNNIAYNLFSLDSSISLLARINTTQTNLLVQSTGNATFMTATISAAYYIGIVVRGTVSINAGGTFIPQYTLSAAPGGAYTTIAGSYVCFYPIGSSGANISVGTWA